MIPINNANSIRYKFIEQKVLEVYENFSVNKFPITIDKIISIIHRLPNCRILSYIEFMKINNCTIDDVLFICDSYSGCTHYNKNNDRYLILYNDSPANNNVKGRILWTLSHELGHVKSGHLPMISKSTLQIAENGLNNLTDATLESEADFFAATFLAPFSLFEILNIKSVTDIQNTFGLSTQASNYRWENYLKWKGSHFKTAFENKMLKYFKSVQ